MATICTYDQLFNAYKARMILAALVGSFVETRALRVARMVWDQFPALFPEVAECILESDPRAACWVIAEEMKSRVGAYDIWALASQTARLMA